MPMRAGGRKIKVHIKIVFKWFMCLFMCWSIVSGDRFGGYETFGAGSMADRIAE